MNVHKVKRRFRAEKPPTQLANKRPHILQFFWRPRVATRDTETKRDAQCPNIVLRVHITQTRLGGHANRRSKARFKRHRFRTAIVNIRSEHHGSPVGGTLNIVQWRKCAIVNARRLQSKLSRTTKVCDLTHTVNAHKNVIRGYVSMDNMAFMEVLKSTKYVTGVSPNDITWQATKCTDECIERPTRNKFRDDVQATVLEASVNVTHYVLVATR
uniref:WGS project CAEQ00000000 data, annotated contig 1507 n=1 Tax=Trypanosoma congolense (strain IL3000) TaxID=1068625 RepID=F9W6Q6_TRYCI|nr:unnamed protein product [Trypanosoma congolense IL3000]